MAWQDRYIQGSFRGVKFYTTGSETRVGQRKAVYEFPFDDRGVSAVSLGKRARSFRLTVFVIGGDYDKDRDKLIEAIEQPGPGLLVHPFLGSVMVEMSSDISIVESSDNGGMAEFTLEATSARAEVPTGPTVAADTKSTLNKHAQIVRDAVREEFVSRLDLTAVSDFVAKANLKTLDNLVADLRTLNGTISTALAVPGHAAYQIAAIADETVRLLGTPGELCDSLVDAMAVVINSVTRVASAVGDLVRPEDERAAAVDAIAASAAALTAAVQGAAELGTDAEPIGAEDLRRNHAALKHLARAAGLSHAAEAAADATYESTQQAREIRDTLTEALELEAESVIAGFEHDATTLAALQDLRAAVWQHLSALELAQLVTYTPAQPVSSLELAYELYGDAERAAEIEARNLLEDPLQILGPVEVLDA